MNNKAIQQIEKGFSDSQKVLSFVQQNADRPSQYWFQTSQEGEILFIVFYTQACRWSRCLSCNLPAQMSKVHVDYKSIMAQVDYLFCQEDILAKRGVINKVIISNNGSVLDEETFSSTALMYLLAKLNLHFPAMSKLCLESCPEVVELEELEFIQRALKEGDVPTSLEFAIGFEVYDENLRNNVFMKGLSWNLFDSFLQKIQKYGYGLKCYFMQKPLVQMSDQDAVDDLWKAIDFLDAKAQEYGIPINMHINPTYVATGTVLESAFKEGRYQPPKLQDTVRVVAHGAGKAITIFVGLYDEDLIVEGGSFIRKGDEQLVAELERFNVTQDYAIVEALLSEQKSSAP